MQLTQEYENRSNNEDYYGQFCKFYREPDNPVCSKPDQIHWPFRSFMHCCILHFYPVNRTSMVYDEDWHIRMESSQKMFQNLSSEN